MTFTLLPMNAGAGRAAPANRDWCLNDCSIHKHASER